VERNGEKMKEKYDILRRLVASQFAITIIDKDYTDNAKVVIAPVNNSHPWTHFRGKTVEDALQRAIDKLKHPEKDYMAVDGQCWKANGTSVYSEKFIRLFLNKER